MKKKKQPSESAVNNFVAKNMAKFTRHQIHEKSYKATRKQNKQGIRKSRLMKGVSTRLPKVVG